MISVLAAGFFVTALLYASVGFGGGSTYSALLALSGLDYRLLPLISLACNIVVVTGSSIRFARAGLTSLTMLLPGREQTDGTPTKAARWMPLAAAPLGYFAGLVGIGGGIFLAPLLHLARWHEARGIAATASLFILVNSLFGLAGQLAKNGPGLLGAAIEAGLPLLIAVVIGGQIGSLMAARLLPPHWIRWLTALLVLVVGARLLAGV